ncbi:hypothetical protein CERSUDRAFT_119352 [Gelatoporia subvermispora B]|uniref:SH3 domain-containing protein n=1 Tax=Ceriporiopsis subvermispora (strain B) TaxID=914234 RepID=M2QI52_CERS8|nr:hypothetical protein CERSUDRAFT_119352 [Gelatoporia subvermispora B]
MQAIEDRTIRHPMRQDTFDLRDQMVADDHPHHAQMHVDHMYTSDEEHSVLEDDSDGDDGVQDYMDDDDRSSDLSIPNESIDFDLVYALHSFAATVEGQANVVKGDSLFLMDDSNSYWWLVRVLKTQEVGYIPAENIETPFERLARLNKHRNVDLASATHAELEEGPRAHRTDGATPSPNGTRTRSRVARGVAFTPSFSVHRYPPAVWGNEEEEEDEDVEWDDEGYEDEDPDLAEEQDERERASLAGASGSATLSVSLEPDDGMSWEDGAVEEIQRKPRAQGAGTSPTETDLLRQHQEVVLVDPRDTQAQAQRLRSPSGAQDVISLSPQEETPLSSSPTRVMDPAQATETRKLSMTPPVARSDEQRQVSPGAGPMRTSPVAQQTVDERKRALETEAAEAARKKANVTQTAPLTSPAPLNVNRGKPAAVGAAEQSPSRSSGGAKLRKERDADDESGKEKDKKKKGGVFGGLFGRKKDKDKGKDKTDTGSSHSIGSERSRESEESGKSISQIQMQTVAVPAAVAEASSPITTSARQQQQQAMQQQQQGVLRNAVSPRPAVQQSQQPKAQAESPQGQTAAPPSAFQAQISQHASQLRQRDQQQQALYQQYLNRSPSTPPEAQPSYGLQSASAVLQGSTSFASSASTTSGLTIGTSRPRPGSLVLSPTTMDGQGVGLPDLSVIRVFAGSNLQTEATFKTVLLNASTTAQDLVRQAIQRFRLPAGDDEGEYYLTIKQVEGSSATLLPHEKPLGVFETLVEAAMELPKVKRSSVGSISSVASNLSMHPAIRKLSMNDFTDDSAVKFYLERRSFGNDENADGDEGEETLLAESVNDEEDPTRSKPQYLSVSTAGGSGVTLERFSSPSYRFPLQLVIYPDDLPDDMVFDPQTEAIVFRNTLRDRLQIGPSPGISQTQRRKVFVFPKNVTVAEVIELGLERFGILEGVVDGGDEVEDKLTKRRSSSRVRYVLTVEINGKEKELSPSSKVIDAYTRPPAFRSVDRRDSKRRSVDSAQLLLGSLDDVQPDDPVFILRRAIAYRPSSRHRSSAPLDEIALQQLHRASIASSSAGSDSTAEQPQMSKQAIIAAQRAASRANQRAILSAQANSVSGVDVLLPGNAMIRSSRYDMDNRMRYSYVEPDGETYDISEIVEQEWKGELPSPRIATASDDLLHGILARNKDGLDAKLNRVLSKIKHEKGSGRGAVSQSTSDSTVDSLRSMESSSLSRYSAADGSSHPSDPRTATPTAYSAHGRNNSTTPGSPRVGSALSRISSYRTASPGDSDAFSRSMSVTPTAGQSRKLVSPHERQSSLSSALSDASNYRSGTPPVAMPVKSQRPRLIFPDDDLGLSDMMSIIEARSRQYKIPESPPLDPVDELLFGKTLDLNALHPDVRDIYSGTFKQLDEMDEILDDLLQHAIRAF